MSAPSDSTPPPNPFDGEWYSHIGGKTYGPFTGHEIRKLADHQRIGEKTLLYPKNGSAWIQAKDDPILGSLFSSPVETKSRSSATRFRKAIARQPTTFIVGVILIVIFCWVVSPYYALYDLIVGLRDGNVSVLEKRVAWDSVRRGLRDDLNAILLQKVKSDAKTSDSTGSSALSNGFATVLGPAIVNNVVDAYVTPQSIANLARTNNSTESRKNDESSNTGAANLPQQLSRLNIDRVKYAFFSGGPLSFKVEVIPDATQASKSPMTLLFGWDGNWKLTRVILPADTIDQLQSTNNKNSLAPITSEKTLATTSMANAPATQNSNEPAPVEVALLNKGFKAADIHANNFEDDITFSLVIKNLTSKDIRAFDGVLTFTDLLDNQILSSKLAINDPILKGSTLSWNGVIKYNQFMDAHKRLRNEAQANLKIKFVPRKFLYTDGSTTQY